MLRLILTATLASFMFTVQGQNGTIPNGGFESWTTDTVLEALDDWVTSEESFPGIGTVSKSTDAIDGNLSLHLQTVLLGSDTAFGFAMLGGMGDNGPESHVLYSDQVDSIVVWLKYSTAADDSITILVSRRDNLQPSPVMEMFKLAGTQTNWTRVAFALAPMSQDSVLVAFASGNAMNDYTVPGTYVFVDDAHFTSVSGTPSDLINHSFENWTSQTLEQVDDWYSLNQWLLGAPQLPVTKTTDAQAGNFAVLIQTLQIGSDTLTGMLLNAPLIPGNQPAAVPYTAMPTTFSGAYKYSGVGGDGGMITCAFYDGGVIVDQPIVQVSTTTGGYNTFSIPVNLSASPDSMVFMAMSGQNPGSQLWLDEIALSGGDVGYQDISISHNLVLYPNPTSDNTFVNIDAINNGNAQLVIVDMLGNVVEQRPIALVAGSNTLSIDVSKYAAGTYAVHVQSERLDAVKILIVR